MTIPNRTVTITGVFASSASTTIPSTPVAGASYRNTALTSTIVSNGWGYKTIVDSSDFNQALYEYSSITSQIEKYGFLPWSNLTDYEQGSLCLGSDGVIYQAKQATGPSTTATNPVNDTAHTYWEDFVGSTFVTKATAQTITGNKTYSGTSTFNGNVAFSATNKSNIVGFVMIDYSGGISVSSGYTAPSGGFLLVRGGGKGNRTLYIDNVEVYAYNWGDANYGSPDQIVFPIKKGSVVTYTKSTSSVSLGITFYPCLGESA